MSESQKKSTFFGGAAILAVSAIFVKVIGAIYRIPLGNILPDDVMGDYNAAYNIYNFFLTISTAGLPVALSKTITDSAAIRWSGCSGWPSPPSSPWALSAFSA